MKLKAKSIHFKGVPLNDLVMKTMESLDQIIGVTLGPGGNPVLIERPGFPPLVTKDGVTVANSVAFSDATQHIISEAAKEACQKTNDTVGDGTTTAIVLANALIKEGIKYLSNYPEKSPQALCREIDMIAQGVVENLKITAVPVTECDLKKVALVSANFDEEIASIVVKAINMVGNDGTIVTEDGKSREMLIEAQNGFTIRKGLSAFGAIQEIFINNPSDQECLYDKPYILLFDGDLVSVPDLAGFLASAFGKMQTEKDIRPIILIAHKFSPQVLSFLAQNVQMNRAMFCPIETILTAQPNSKHHLLHDLAAFSDAIVLDGISNTFTKMIGDDCILDCLGVCDKAKIGRYLSVFFACSDENFPGPQKTMERMEILKEQMKNAESEFDSEIIKERIGQLSGGMATIYVGGSSDLEIREKKHRIEDTINSVRSAIEMGVIEGGGAALLLASAKLLANAGKSADCPTSATLVGLALAVPFSRIMENAGCTAKTIQEAIAKTLESSGKIIFDSLTHKYVTPFEAGIVDPVKVTISALVNAVSIASQLMTLGGAIVIPRDTTEERLLESQNQAFANQMQGTGE